MDGNSTPPEEFIALDDLDCEQWYSYAEDQGWGDGLPTIPPTEEAVSRCTALVASHDASSLPAIPPRGATPTLHSIAANAIMAGCRPEYFPAVLAAVHASLEPDFNLHGALATTHPCAPLVILNGPMRHELDVNCGTNCMGQGTRANATIGRALHFVYANIGGAVPKVMDRATHGAPSKFTFCFGENEEDSPWPPYHVRRGFKPTDNIVTVSAVEPPHNINDHGSRTGEGILTTIAHTISEVGSNNVYVRGPHFLVLGPEHARTLDRDKWTIEAIQDYIYEHSRIHISRISKGNRAEFTENGIEPRDDHYYVSTGPQQLQVLVAGGSGKHSAWIPSFGATAAISRLVP